MKAIIYTKYGPPEVLQLKEVKKSTPKEDEVLVEVHAASVNYGDVSFARGKPFLVRSFGEDLAGWLWNFALTFGGMLP